MTAHLLPLVVIVDGLFIQYHHHSHHGSIRRKRDPNHNQQQQQQHRDRHRRHSPSSASFSVLNSGEHDDDATVPFQQQQQQYSNKQKPYTSFLCKTNETFKLSELHYLEIEILTQARNDVEVFLDPSSSSSSSSNCRYNVQRVLLDRATGSTLYRLDVVNTVIDVADRAETETETTKGVVGDADSRPNDYLRPPPAWLIRRCDWIGRIMYEEETVDALLHQIRHYCPPPQEGDVDGHNDQDTNAPATTHTKNPTDDLEDTPQPPASSSSSSWFVFRPNWILNYYRFIDIAINNKKKEKSKNKNKKNDNVNKNNNNNNNSNNNNRNKERFTMKTILCSVSQAIPTIPALDPSINTDDDGDTRSSDIDQQFMIIDAEYDTIHTTDAGAVAKNTYFLVEQVNCIESFSFSFSSSSASALSVLSQHNDFSSSTKNNNNINNEGGSIVMKHWSRRPFQYSSAINIDVADSVIALLSDLMTIWSSSSSASLPSQPDTTESRVLLDPTCGSGTFLAFAIARGMKVEGYDINPACIAGTHQNLQFLFGDDKVQQLVRTLECSDSSNTSSSTSSLHINDDTTTTTTSPNTTYPIDCVCANLPWGQNTVIIDNDENRRILQSVRQRIPVGIPCAFITRGSLVDDDDDDDDDRFDERTRLFRSCGYEVLGQVSIPPRGVNLTRLSKKEHAKRKKKNSNNNAKNTSTKGNRSNSSSSNSSSNGNGNSNKNERDHTNTRKDICVVTIARSS